jgi:HlyD family secretion protein
MQSPKKAPLAPSPAEREPAVLLEFLSPAAAMAATPIPTAARGIIWMVASLFAACLASLGLIQVDRVVTAPGRVVAKAGTIVVQPLETAIVRAVAVHEGQPVREGELLAQLDPTFAAADAGSLEAQVSSLQAEVARLEAELDERPYQAEGIDGSSTLQASIYLKRQAERRFKLESYRQKIDGLTSAVTRQSADAAAYRDRIEVEASIETMRRKLEQLELGSKLNTLAATDSRIETERNLTNSSNLRASAQTDLAAMIAERDSYMANWRAQTAQSLLEQSRKLSDAREQLSKAQRRRQLVELRAERDAIVLSVAKISAGAVLQPGEPLITLVAIDAPLEIEANIAGRDDGFVHDGDPVAIKFDTFPFSQYGMALGTLRVVSPDSFTAANEQPASRMSGAVAAPPGSTEPFYRARISLDRVALHDVPAGFRVVPGMPVTADIKVGRHSVLGYLLGRLLRVTSEGMREP